jgi:hypothetical protein
MREVVLKITLRSPTLLASAPPASNLLETLRFVPGNTVRGILARRYLDLGRSPETEEFRRLFLSGEVRFGFAFVGSSEVIPLSARSCKYDSGFSNEGGHGVVDLLLDGKEHCPAPACGRPLDYFQGFWSPTSRRKVSVETTLLTRTAIDVQRGTAATGQLFSQRALSGNQTLFASLEASGDLAAQLESLLAEPFKAFLGTGGSRGQGWAEVESSTSTRNPIGSARERYERFRSAARKPVLAVTLLTDGLFRDDYLRDATSPSLRDLAPLEIRPDDWQPRPTRAFMDVRRVFGFDGVPIRLPRPPRLAVAAGSTFLWESREGRNPAIPRGEGGGWIGDVNGEGYGKAVLWHPFHLDAEGTLP